MGFIFVSQINSFSCLGNNTMLNGYPLSTSSLCIHFLWPSECVPPSSKIHFNLKYKNCYNQITIRLFCHSLNWKIESTLFKWHFNDIITKLFSKIKFQNLVPFSNYKLRWFWLKSSFCNNKNNEKKMFAFQLKPSNCCLRVKHFLFFLVK